MLVSSPLLLWLAWSLAKPARKLKNAADEVAQGNLRQHPELEAGPQEFLAAGTSFNQMVSALDRMMTAQQRLLSDISHELRTRLRACSLAPRCCAAAAVRAKSWSVLKRKRTAWTA
jgi:two-component system sensor histidine kinase CpxA